MYSLYVFNITYKLNNIINKKTQFLIQKLKHNYYEYSDKSGKYLANQLRRQQEKTIIQAIKNSEGRTVYTPNDISTTFQTLYSNLYKPNCTPNQTAINTFFDNIDLPKLSEIHANILDRPIMLDDCEKALQAISNNKAPGSDGFPTEFYKHFWTTISPLFIKMTTEIY